MKTTTIFGGVGQNPQVSALAGGLDVVIACPGRLEDLIEQGHCDLGAVEVTILDEADHMADLGFLPGVKRIMDRTPKVGQRLLFSATLDNGVDVLVKRYLSNPTTHSVDPAVAPVSTMTHHVLPRRRRRQGDDRRELASGLGRSVLFTRTKHQAKKLAKQLTAAGIPAVDLHGNLSQNARERNLEAFSNGTTRVLCATDIAARGIHVDDVALVVHVDPPAEHKAYLHRSGRTARAGAEGTVVTIATPDQAGEVRTLARQAGITPTTTAVAPGDAMLVQLAPGERSLPGGLVVEAPTSGGGGRSTGANAQRKRARSAGQTNGRSRREPDQLHQRDPQRLLDRWRSTSSLRWRPGRPGRSGRRLVVAPAAAVSPLAPRRAAARTARRRSAAAADAPWAVSR